MTQGKSYSKLAMEALSTQERLQSISDTSKNLVIGVPKETALQDKRVALDPSSVSVLVNNGNHVLIEKDAGKLANFNEREYAEAGAKIVTSREEVFSSNIILKVGPPTLRELEIVKAKSTIFSAVQVGKQSKEYFEKINQKKVTAVGFEFIQDRWGNLPFVRAMSEVAGRSVLSIASEYLGDSKIGRGMIVGGITGVPTTKVLILGAGTVAEFAVKSMLSLGAEVKVLDNDIYKLRRLKQIIGTNFFTSTLDSKVLEKELSETDVLVGAVRIEKQKKIIVTEEMIATMKKGAVVIDVSIDQGGCIETSEITTHHQPIFIKYDVVHYCVPNIASRIPQTSSKAISNIYTPLLLNIQEHGGVEDMMKANEWFRRGVYTYGGKVTNKMIATLFSMDLKDLDLLMMTRI